MTPSTKTKTNEIPAQVAEPKSPAEVKKAVALGKEMGKKGDEVTKADIARAMWPLIKDESRDVVVQAFIEGAALTPKGAQTYFYNCKRWARKQQS